MEESPRQDPECPLDCPNRKPSDRSTKIAVYAFALVCTIFLAFQCLAADRRDREVSPTVWMPCLLLIGASLGVQIDANFLSGLLKK